MFENSFIFDYHNFDILRVHTVPSQNLLSPSTVMRLMELNVVVISHGQTSQDVELVTNAHNRRSTQLKTSDSVLRTDWQGGN